jgi:uncharacterized membrane protein YgdD (TMEM256/DUF423 family)
MSPRFWIFAAALLGGLAVAAGAVGAHALPDTPVLAVARRIYDTGQQYHALHALALLAVAIVLMMTEGKRAAWAGWLLQAAAFAFAIGIVCFSGGIYVQVIEGVTSGRGIVPLGGSLLIAGWAAFAIGALGIKRS